jgi:hypothetical protein
LHSRTESSVKAQIAVEMKKLKEFLIPFIGLKLGKHQFEYQIVMRSLKSLIMMNIKKFRYQSKCGFR